MKKPADMIYEDGTPVGRYTVVPNDVLEKVADISLTKAQRKVLDRIIRDTIGYETTKDFSGKSIRRLTHDISIDRFKDKTGLTEQEVKDALDDLENRQMIKRKGDSITFNKELGQWLGSRKANEDAKERKSFKEAEEVRQRILRDTFLR